MSDKSTIKSIGRRKSAVARIQMKPGTGNVTVNHKPLDEYFPTLALQNILLHPFEIANQPKNWDLNVTTNGGGTTGQIGAVRLAIARALLKNDPELRDAFRAEGLLTRDSRKKERKKAGQPGARKRFQFSKR
ncbi:MAG: 30S ribosomal protein S9 [Candidatus Marinimicrobia bacterium]|nr:30S ribosomal protein S9 [Candidatus Neomarinimicrobiota bacterium]